jgi:hypothetical protein
MLPYIAEEKKKTKAWWMDGWIDSWRGWMGAAGRMETLLNIGRGAAKQKTLAVSPNVFRRSPGWAPRMHCNK